MFGLNNHTNLPRIRSVITTKLIAKALETPALVAMQV